MYYLVNMDHNGMADHLCCISNVMDETDGMVWNGSEGDGNVRSVCEEDEDTDSEDGDSVTDW
jgi:hypothetical protein